MKLKLKVVLSFILFAVVIGYANIDKASAAQAFIKPADGSYTSYYGERWGKMHYGVDIAGSGTIPVKASASGVVNRVATGCSNNGSYGDTCNSGYGNFIILRHTIGGKTYDTLYAHLKSVNVSVGQTVSQGAQIGIMGNSGSSTGQHLHFELYVGARTSQTQAVDPMPYLTGKLPVVSYHTYDGTWATITITQRANLFEYVGYGILRQLDAGGKYKVYGQREYAADGTLYYNVGAGYVHNAYGTIANHHATVNSTINTYKSPNGAYNRQLAPGTYKVHAAKDGWYDLGANTWVNANQVLVTKN